MSTGSDERSSKDRLNRHREKALLTSLARLDDAPADERERLRVRVEALRGELRALPDDAVPEDLWAGIESRVFPATTARRATALRTTVWASAAAVLAAVAASLWRDVPDRAGDTTERTGVAALVRESQRLERDLRPDLLDGGAKLRLGGDRLLRWRASRGALVYRLADIDDELTAVSLAPGADPGRAERLWRERVELMQSLGNLERVEEWQAVRTVVF